jgi:hypothetical protein
VEASPRFWGCGGRLQRHSGGSASSSLTVFGVDMSLQRERDDTVQESSLHSIENDTGKIGDSELGH